LQYHEDNCQSEKSCPAFCLDVLKIRRKKYHVYPVNPV
jgi:hypothetical protein